MKARPVHLVPATISPSAIPSAEGESRISRPDTDFSRYGRVCHRAASHNLYAAASSRADRRCAADDANKKLVPAARESRRRSRRGRVIITRDSLRIRNICGNDRLQWALHYWLRQRGRFRMRRINRERTCALSQFLASRSSPVISISVAFSALCWMQFCTRYPMR